jgi:lipopolysaccharide export system permease protein
VYYNLINLSQAWIGSGRYTMGPTLLTLHGGMFMLALALIFWRERAATFRLFPPRAARSPALGATR